MNGIKIKNMNIWIKAFYKDFLHGWTFALNKNGQVVEKFRETDTWYITGLATCDDYFLHKYFIKTMEDYL